MRLPLEFLPGTLKNTLLFFHQKQKYFLPLDTIRAQLDSGLPVHGLFETEPHNKDPFWRDLNLNGKGYYPGISYTKKFDRSSSWADHSILIVGYGLNKKGEITHLLLKNSKGNRFGEKGFFNASLEFMKTYMSGARILIAE